MYHLFVLWSQLLLTPNHRQFSPKTYVFDIVEIVPDADKTRSFKLRLLCRDEAKGPVTALCGLNGYLVSSMGQKVLHNLVVGYLMLTLY